MISRPHKNRWYFLIQVFFYFYFAFCGNKSLLSSQNRKMTKLRKLLAKSYRTSADISQPHGKEPARRGRWGCTVRPEPHCCPRCKASPAKTQRPREMLCSFSQTGERCFSNLLSFIPKRECHLSVSSKNIILKYRYI